MIFYRYLIYSGLLIFVFVGRGGCELFIQIEYATFTLVFLNTLVMTNKVPHL